MNFKVIASEWVINQSNLKEELKCRICLGILRNPMECKTCETCFCSSCLEKWLKESYKCPLKCSEDAKFKSKPHKIIRNMLSDLILSCSNKEHGCLEELTYDQIEEHEMKHCQYELVSCAGVGDGCTA